MSDSASEGVGKVSDQASDTMSDTLSDASFFTTPDAPEMQFLEPVHACHVPFNPDIDGIDTEHRPIRPFEHRHSGCGWNIWYSAYTSSPAPWTRSHSLRSP